MKRVAYLTSITVPVLFWLCTAFPLTDWKSSARGITSARGIASQYSSANFDRVLQAHGGQEAIVSVRSLKGVATQLTATSTGDVFERSVNVEIEQEKFKREILDPLGVRRWIEVYDGQGDLHSEIVTTDENGESKKQVLYSNHSRTQDVQFSVSCFGLLPLLKKFSDPAATASFVERTSDRLDKFRVLVSGEEWIVFTDQAHLVRQVQKGKSTYRFADYRSVGQFKLPFIQRVSIGSRLLTELYFQKLETNIRFSADYFSH